MTKTRTATAQKPSLFLKAFAVLIATIGLLLFFAVLTGIFQNI